MEFSNIKPLSEAKIFDSHAHYDDERFDGILDELLPKIHEMGVGKIVNCGCDNETNRKCLEIAEEQAKKAAEKEKAENVATIAQIGIEDFMKVELTAAKIVDCEAVPKAKKLLKLTLDDGNGTRTVASGIAKFYTPDELKGKTVILVSNLKPAKLCGIESQGMILAADCGEDVKVIFLDDVPAGSKIR